MSANCSPPGLWKRHLDKIGVGGSLCAALCCLGFPALLAIVSAVGLGFLIRDAVLIPLLVVFLALTLWGLYHGMQRHGGRQPLAVGVVASAVLFSSIWSGSAVAAGIGIAALVASSLLNVWLTAPPRAETRSRVSLDQRRISSSDAQRGDRRGVAGPRSNGARFHATERAWHFLRCTPEEPRCRAH